MTDDFLHNLRSSHRQRFDRNRKPYDNPQYRKNDAANTRDRKSNFGRRGTDPEAMGSLKKLLEGLLESQKSLTQAVQDVAQSQQRQAIALERIAGALVGSHPSAVALEPLSADAEMNPVAANSHSIDPMETAPPIDPPSTAPVAAAMAQGGLDAEGHSSQMLAVIADLQENGYSFERIARHLADHQVPTPSGRGQWRGALVSRIIKDQAVAGAAE